MSGSSPCFRSSPSIPTLLVVIFASMLFQSGVKFWFSDQAQTVLTSAESVSQIYEREHRDRIDLDVRVMGARRGRPDQPVRHRQRGLSRRFPLSDRRATADRDRRAPHRAGPGGQRHRGQFRQSAADHALPAPCAPSHARGRHSHRLDAGSDRDGGETRPSSCPCISTAPAGSARTRRRNSGRLKTRQAPISRRSKTPGGSRSASTSC